MNDLQIKTFINIIDQMYNIEKKKGVSGKKIFNNIVNKLYEENTNFTRNQLENIVTSVINSIEKRNNKYPKKSFSILEQLVNNLNKEDNKYNRNKLRRKLNEVLNSNNNKDIDSIYSIYFDAIKNNNITLFNVIIDSDIDVIAVDNTGNSGLHYAVYNNRLNIIMILLQNDAKLIKNNSGYTPEDLLKTNIVNNINETDKNNILDILEYRKNKTFKMNTSVSLFGKHNNLINLNCEEQLMKIKGANGILVFYMVTCGWCKKMQNDIKMLCERGTKVYIMESNYVNINIKKTYDINGFPTIYILKNKKQIKYNENDRSYITFEKLLKK